MKMFAVPNMTYRWQYFTGGGGIEGAEPSIAEAFWFGF